MNDATSATARNSFTDRMLVALDDVAREWPSGGVGRSLSHTYVTWDDLYDPAGRTDTVDEEGDNFITFGEGEGLQDPWSEPPPIRIIPMGPGQWELQGVYGPMGTMSSNADPIGAYAEHNPETGRLDVVTFHADGSSAILRDVAPHKNYQLPF